MKDTVEARAVKIAAKVMQAAGLCRHESAASCRRIYVDETTCDKCIRSWLLSKARKELKNEEKDAPADSVELVGKEETHEPDNQRNTASQL